MSKKGKRWDNSMGGLHFTMLDAQCESRTRWLNSRAGSGVQYEIGDGRITGISIRLAIMREAMEVTRDNINWYRKGW